MDGWIYSSRRQAHLNYFFLLERETSKERIECNCNNCKII